MSIDSDRFINADEQNNNEYLFAGGLITRWKNIIEENIINHFCKSFINDIQNAYTMFSFIKWEKFFYTFKVLLISYDVKSLNQKMKF